jgi:hypothetical protein
MNEKPSIENLEVHNKVQEVAKQYNIILLQWQKKT